MKKAIILLKKVIGMHRGAGKEIAKMILVMDKANLLHALPPILA